MDYSGWRNKVNKGMKTLSNRSVLCFFFLIDDNFMGTLLFLLMFFDKEDFVWFCLISSEFQYAVSVGR